VAPRGRAEVLLRAAIRGRPALRRGHRRRGVRAGRLDALSPAGAAILRAERTLVARAVAAASEIPGGWRFRHPPLGDVWHLNRLQITEPGWSGSAAGLVQLADRWLDGAGHRRVTIDDETVARRLAPQLAARGFEPERALVMIHRGPAPAAATRATPARRLDEAVLRAAQHLALLELGGPGAAAGALAGRLADAQVRLRAAAMEAIGFGAGEREDGGPASTATLLLAPAAAGRGPVGLIDQVATLRAHRERGLARAVVGAAITAAQTAGADPIGLLTLADDWPQLMYARLGFVPVAVQTSFTRLS
jgi:ribosomal protein S18 acetylase RimI-like enzyme